MVSEHVQSVDAIEGLVLRVGDRSLSIAVVGATLRNDQLTIHNVGCVGEAPSSGPNVKAVFSRGGDAWELRAEQHGEEVVVHLSCADGPAFEIRRDGDFAVLLDQGGTRVGTSHLADFESSDQAKLRLLNVAFSVKYGVRAITMFCVRPMSEVNILGGCGDGCLYNSECSGFCPTCKWLTGFFKCRSNL